MAKPLAVRHTSIARAKIKEIYGYSCTHWGKKVATKYLQDIEAVIVQASIDCGGSNRSPEFSTRLSYSPAGQHLIFFEVKNKTLIVATIFHAMMNIQQRLADEMASIQREMSD